MMHYHELLVFLWTKASMKMIYIQMRSPHRILEDNSPKEVFIGQKPKVRNLRIFGFSVYIHVPKDKRKKLDPSRKRGIFIRYKESSKAYIIYVCGHW